MTVEEKTNEIGAKFVAKIQKNFGKYLRELKENGIEVEHMDGFIKLQMKNDHAHTDIYLYPEIKIKNR